MNLNHYLQICNFFTLEEREREREREREPDRQMENRGRMLMKMWKVPARYSMVPAVSSKF